MCDSHADLDNTVESGYMGAPVYVGHCIPEALCGLCGSFVGQLEWAIVTVRPYMK